MWRRRARQRQVVRAATNVLFILIICACAVPKMTVKTGPAKTRPAGPLATALGIINQLGKFNPNIAKFSEPLREQQNFLVLWGPSQDTAIEKLKDELTQPTVLTLYDLDAKVKILPKVELADILKVNPK